MDDDSASAAGSSPLRGWSPRSRASPARRVDPAARAATASRRAAPTRSPAPRGRSAHRRRGQHRGRDAAPPARRLRARAITHGHARRTAARTSSTRSAPRAADVPAGRWRQRPRPSRACSRRWSSARPHLKVGGTFGPGTPAALVNEQQRQGRRTATGIYGPKTAARCSGRGATDPRPHRPAPRGSFVSVRAGLVLLRRPRDVALHAAEDHAVERCDRPPVELAEQPPRVEVGDLPEHGAALLVGLHPQVEPGQARAAASRPAAAAATPSGRPRPATSRWRRPTRTVFGRRRPRRSPGPPLKTSIQPRTCQASAHEYQPFTPPILETTDHSEARLAATGDARSST